VSELIESASETFSVAFLATPAAARRVRSGPTAAPRARARTVTLRAAFARTAGRDARETGTGATALRADRRLAAACAAACATGACADSAFIVNALGASRESEIRSRF
jgi:hypothetical protein